MVLQVPAGARPTTGRVREALFSILGTRVVGATVLDCFAGAGTLGFEALSRGAASVVAVETAREAVAAIRANNSKLGFGDRLRVVAAEVTSALSRLEAPATLVLADPPYDLEGTAAMLRRCASLLAPGGLVVVERSVRREPVGLEGLVRTSSRVYGETALDFFAAGESGSADAL
jgi:16S rRNA (guanine966-N2)-methyltransferase